MSRNTWVLLALLILAAASFLHDREKSQPPGVLVAEQPTQVNLPPEQQKPIQLKDATIRPLATYDIRARVLSIRHYWFDHFSKLAPYDFAVGWGLMSDTSIIQQLHIYQEDRFYFYQWKNPAPAQAQLMAENSANMHLLPADNLVKRFLSNVHVGEIVHLKGSLVRINYPDGGQIVSSLVRTDTGPGSCEVMWVTEAE